MDNKRSPKQGLEAFFAGKGFYIALLLCVVVIGAAAWAMWKNAKPGTVGVPVDIDAELAEYGAAEYTPYTPVGMQAPAPHSGGMLAPDSMPEDDQPLVQATPEPKPAQITETDAAPEPAAPVFNETDGEISTSQIFCWPLNGEIENPYSADALVFNRTMSDWRTHAGVDIAAELGAQVMAVASGRVESIYTDDLYGTTVVINHLGGLRSVYANLAQTPTVQEGDSVMAGEIIGAVGTTALCETGEVTHLHFAMTLDGESLDPAEYLP